MKRWLRVLEYEGDEAFIKTLEKRAVIGQKILPNGSIREAMIGEFPQNIVSNVMRSPRMASEAVGKSVECAVCGLRKKPWGRSAAVEEANSLCDFECPGYQQDPQVGDLWPGETREEFGYGE